MLGKLKNKFRKSTLAHYHRIISEEYWMRRQKFASTPFGFQLMGDKVFQTGAFEPELVDLVKCYLPKTDIFLDIGANIGYYTCLARSMNTYVVAIEPLADNLRILYQNLEINDWNDVEVWPVALGAKPKMTKIYGKGTAASLIKYREHDYEKWEQSVVVNSLDNILNTRFNNKQLFVKMDVEGLELDVLQGAANTLLKNPKPFWLVENPIEYHAKQQKNLHFSEIFKIFKECGYNAFTGDKKQRMVGESDINRWIKTGTAGSGKFINWFFVPHTKAI